MTSFLWKRKSFQSFKSKKQMPSPKHEPKSNILCAFIEKTSRSLSRRVSAGMTVEAAVVLPLFLFFFVNLGCAVEMIRLHGNLQLALWNVGNKICMYGYAAESECWDQMAGVALSYTYVKSEMIRYAGSEYLEGAPLANGAAGLQFWESNLPAADDTVDILLTYRASPWLEIPAVRPFRMQNRYYGHLWTGYKIPGTGGTEEDADLVYLAEYASVYHEDINCTHLKLTISEVTLAEALASRNEYGARYAECSKCRGAPHNATVFIGKEGDCYHYDRGCSGLKRTVRAVPRKQAEKTYRPCSRCAGKSKK